MDRAEADVSASSGATLARPLHWEAPDVAESIPREAGFQLPVGTVTLLLTDVEGSTSRWERDPRAMGAAHARLDGILTEVIGRHRGVRPLEQGEGDSAVVAFSRASDAVACALDLQRAMASETWPTDAPIRLRIGLHTGEVQLRDEGSYIGQAVNRAARLRDIGHGGQTLLSRATHDLVLDSLPEEVSLQDLGPHRLRDLARPEHVYQLNVPGLPAEFPPLRSLDALPNNLPMQLTSFIGRERELEQGSGLLRDARMVTVTGSGGCGKTRLAVQLAARVLEEHPAGTWWVDLAPVTDAALVPSAIASALSARELPAQPPLTAVTRHLADRSLLLILDNCEHVIEPCADVAAAVLRACPNVTILATSREPVGVEGETVWRIPSLSTPRPTEPEPIEALTQYEAVRLFVDRATRARPNFAVTNDNAPAVAEICHRLDGIPLAIELAAARTRTLPPEGVLDGLADRFRLLTGGVRTALPRQQTLEASVEWSYELLSKAERTIFRRLAVFLGSFTLDAAERVCSGDGIDAYEVLDLVSRLVDRSLVQMDVEAGEGRARYRMLETIRQYGRRKLAETDERRPLLDRLLAFCEEFVDREAVELEGPGITRSLDRVDAELDNLRAAMDWALESGQAGAALGLTGKLGPYWLTRAKWTEARARLEAALEAGPADPHARGMALIALVTVAVRSFDLPEARARAEEAATLGEESGDDKVLGRARTGLAWIAGLLGDPDAARLFDGAIEPLRAAEDPLGLSLALSGRGNMALLHGDLSAAESHLDEALALAHETGNPFLVQVALTWYAWTALLRADFDEAVRLAVEAQGIARSLTDAFFQAETLHVLGEVAANRGKFEEANERFHEALELGRGEQNPYLVLLSETELGLLASRRGDPPGARARLEGALALARPLGIAWGILQQLAGIGEAAVASGDLDVARERLDEAAELGRTENGSPYRWSIGLVKLARGRVERASGDEDAADAELHGALEIFSTGGLQGYGVDCLEELGGIAANGESPMEAARLLGAADAIRQRLGYVREEIQRERYETDVAQTRDALERDAFRDAWSEGEALSFDDAVAYARRGRGERKRPSTGWRSLTPAELGVARLMADGQSNREIGERLFISAGTVKVHLSHIYAKLGISSRAELAAEAVRRGVEVS